jgi:putative PIN family toxin of toxin-antitoxin system
MRVFLDTNVLVSATATRGLCADALREVLISHQLVIPVTVIEELQHTLRTKFGVPQDIIAELIEFLKKEALISAPGNVPDIKLQDKSDLIILSSAINGKADLFITGDRELLDLQKFGAMEIISPRMFWEKLKA